MDITEAPANFDPLAYNPRLWEGLRSRTNRYDDTNTSPRRQPNGRRDIPRAVMHGDQHAHIRIEAIRDSWYKYYRTVKGRPYFYNTTLEVSAETCVHHKDVLHLVFAVPRDQVFLGAYVTDFHLGSFGGTTCCYHITHGSLQPICLRATSMLGIPGIRSSKRLFYAYPFVGCWAHTERVSGIEAHLGAVEDEVKGVIAGNMHDSVTSDGSTSPFSTTKSGAYLLERGRVSGSSTCRPNSRASTTQVPDAAGAQHYTRHHHTAGSTGPLSSSSPLLPTRLNLSSSPVDSSYVASAHTERGARLDYTPVTPSPIANRVASNPPTSTGRATSVGVRQSVKKALVIGINYCRSTLLGAGRLRFAINDAKRVARSLKGYGFSEDNIVLLTDQCRGRATYDALMESIRWLVDDAKAGDTLFFFYSGHGCNNHPQYGTGLVTEDDRVVTRYQLEDSLVGRVPEGCELQLVIDSCFASSMIKLQYRVKQMAPIYDILSSATMVARPAITVSDLPGLLPPTQAIPRPSVRVAFAGSRSTPGLANHPEPGLASLTAGLDQSALPKNVVAVPRCVAETIASQVKVYPSLPADTCQLAHPATPSSIALSFSATHNRLLYTQHTPLKANQVHDSFYQRPGEAKIAKPAGRVFFWAGSGENQIAFESYNAPGVRDGVIIQNGIVANASGTPLSGQRKLTAVSTDAFASKQLVVRDVWQFLAQVMLFIPVHTEWTDAAATLSDNLEQENVWRHERDSKKSGVERAKLIPANRVQLAELWVSQHEPLYTTASMLDRPMFPS